MVGVMKIRRLSFSMLLFSLRKARPRTGNVAQNRNLGILGVRIVLHQAAHDERVGVGNEHLGVNAAHFKYVGRVSLAAEVMVCCAGEELDTLGMTLSQM